MGCTTNSDSMTIKPENHRCWTAFRLWVHGFSLAVPGHFRARKAILLEPRRVEKQIVFCMSKDSHD
jgi:hypothetical protein